LPQLVSLVIIEMQTYQPFQGGFCCKQFLHKPNTPCRQHLNKGLAGRPKTEEKSELEGITLEVYLFVVKDGKPVGPRDVMKGAHLSSPSVAYRHLQKLEELGLLQKNEYGEYFVKQRAKMRGYIWIGRRLTSKMMLYAITFMGILATEIIVLAIHYEVENYKFKVFFALLIAVTTAAMGLFLWEAMLERKRTAKPTPTE